MQKSQVEEKRITINGIGINYKIAGKGPALLILHGWGRGSDSWEAVQVRLAQQGYRVLVPDLPGFGKTEAPKSVWGVKEYADFILQFAEMLRLHRFILFGHSFGGQVAVWFAAAHPEKLEKLILVAPAAIRKEPGPRENVIKYVAKAGSIALSLIPSEKIQGFLRKVFSRIIGRSDYLEAGEIKRKIMQKVIREDLSELFSHISTNTLLLWGEKDRPVPIEDAYVIKRQLPNSSLKIIPGAGHRIHREAPEQVAAAVLLFLRA